MRVMIGIAPWSHKDTLPKTMAAKSFLNKRFAMTNSLNYPAGVLYMCATLREAGHTPRFVDGYFHSTEQILQKIEQFEPEVFGLSCIQFGWEGDKRLLARVRERFPSLKIMVGGYYPTHWEKRCLEESDDIDFVIVGEGEHAVVQLCEALEGKRDFDTVAGLVRRQNGKIVKNAVPAVIHDLDALPFPDYSQVNFWDYSPAIGSYKALPSAMMFGSRGCSNRCAFCMSNKYVRYRSPENIVEEILMLQGKYRVRHLQFFDETFTLERDRAFAILEQMLAAGIRISWTANARADTVDLDLLKAMRRAGCWRIHVGGESAVQKNLDAICKGITPAQIRSAVKMIKRAGLESYASFIIGIPGETREEALETIRFACELPLDFANFHNLTPAEGSPIDRDIEEHGRIVGPRSFHQITFVPHTMAVDDVAELLTIAYKKFYFRPRYLVKKFFAQRSLEDVRRNLRRYQP